MAILDDQGGQGGFQAQFNALLQVLTKISATLAGVAIPSSNVKGTATNDNAPAGFIGEYVSSTVPAGSPVALTSTVAANITSIPLTPGDWDVCGSVVSAAAGGTTTQNFIAWTSTVSATMPTAPNNGALFLDERASAAGTNNIGVIGIQRISIAAPTTVYLGARVDFSVSTLSAYGFIGARRAR